MVTEPVSALDDSERFSGAVPLALDRPSLEVAAFPVVFWLSVGIIAAVSAHSPTVVALPHVPMTRPEVCPVAGERTGVVVGFATASQGSDDTPKEVSVPDPPPPLPDGGRAVKVATLRPAKGALGPGVVLGVTGVGSWADRAAAQQRRTTKRNAFTFTTSLPSGWLRVSLRSPAPSRGAAPARGRGVPGRSSRGHRGRRRVDRLEFVRKVPLGDEPLIGVILGVPGDHVADPAAQAQEKLGQGVTRRRVAAGADSQRGVGLGAGTAESGERDSNPKPPAWLAAALPVELSPHARACRSSRSPNQRQRNCSAAEGAGLVPEGAPDCGSAVWAAPRIA